MTNNARNKQCTQQYSILPYTFYKYLHLYDYVFPVVRDTLVEQNTAADKNRKQKEWNVNTKINIINAVGVDFAQLYQNYPSLRISCFLHKISNY